MPHKKPIAIIVTIVAIVFLALAGGAYWYLFLGPDASRDNDPSLPPDTTGGQSGFRPLDSSGRPTTPTKPAASTTPVATNDAPTVPAATALPVLRLLSATPIGGYGASTTKATTTIRWVDRGRGNVYEANYTDTRILTISNTVVPRIYRSAWNKDLSAFIASMLDADGTDVTTVYTQIVRQATSTEDIAPYALRGRRLPDGILTYTLSPKKDRLFMLVAEDGINAGYVSAPDGSGATRIFTTPLTQVDVEWPADNAITLRTKSSATFAGYLYLIDPKTGAWTGAIGPKRGLSATVSRDGKYALWSGLDDDGAIETGLRSLARGTDTDPGIRTLADKCVWGRYYTGIVYCAVPTQTLSGVIPDDWLRGKENTIDSLWQVDAPTGAAQQITDSLGSSDGEGLQIDAFTLDIDGRDEQIFFMDKRDLSLWSLSL